MQVCNKQYYYISAQKTTHDFHLTHDIIWNQFFFFLVCIVICLYAFRKKLFFCQTVIENKNILYDFLKSLMFDTNSFVRVFLNINRMCIPEIEASQWACLAHVCSSTNANPPARWWTSECRGAHCTQLSH